MLGDRDLSDAGVEMLSDDVLLLLGFLQEDCQNTDSHVYVLQLSCSE